MVRIVSARDREWWGQELRASQMRGEWRENKMEWG